MKMKEFLDTGVHIKGAVKLRCDTSSDGIVDAVFSSIDRIGERFLDREIKEISGFKADSGYGILFELEGVQRNADGTMTMYKVAQKYFDSGKVKASIEKVDVSSAPEREVNETEGYDEYIDYFDTWAEAEQYKEDALNA